MNEALIYLAAAVVIVPLAQRLGLGAVLGYLIAGVAIGPWALALIEDVEAILHFSEFGVVLMLFLIGLELDPKRLWEMRREVFGSGSAQLALCALILAAGCLYAGMGVRGAVVAGLALALSSTAVAVRSMTDLNLMPTPVGRSAFAVLLFQDIAAIPLLALVPLLAVTDALDPAQFAEQALRAVAAVAGIIVIGRYLTRPALRLVAAAKVREIFTAFSLLLVIGISQFMVWAGLSAALGAFLAGVLLASSEYRHAIENDIDPFKGLLLGLFFMSVGMSIDFGLVLAAPGRIVLALAAFLAAKLLALALLARLVGINTRQRWLFAVLLAQGGEFAFVVFAAARGAGLLARDWEALLTMVVALSMATTPLLLLAHERLTGWLAGRAPRPHDAIEAEGDGIIICGYGRFGQIVGRLLLANGIRPTVLDHDPDQIELLRRMGHKVFYGDATRLSLLKAAGAERARLLVNAIDDVADSLLLTQLARRHFPGTAILARARNVSHYVELRVAGVDVVERESFESALRLGRRALEALGYDPFRARELADAFRRHNLATLENLLPHFHDEVTLLSAARAGRQELEELFALDRQRFEAQRQAAANWGDDTGHADDRATPPA